MDLPFYKAWCYRRRNLHLLIAHFKPFKSLRTDRGQAPGCKTPISWASGLFIGSITCALHCRLISEVRRKHDRKHEEPPGSREERSLTWFSSNTGKSGASISEWSPANTLCKRMCMYHRIWSDRQPQERWSGGFTFSSSWITTKYTRRGLNWSILPIFIECRAGNIPAVNYYLPYIRGKVHQIACPNGLR